MRQAWRWGQSVWTRLRGRVAQGQARPADQAELFAARPRDLRPVAALLVLGVVGWGVYSVARNPPLAGVAPGEIGIRVNRLTGGTTQISEGSALLVPGVHDLRRVSLREQTYQAAQPGEAPFQSVEGLSFNVDLTVRYALDRDKLATMAATLPEDIGNEVIAPRVQGVIYKVFSRYAMREIFSSKRAEIQQAIQADLTTLLAADGIQLRAVTLGKVELPAEYRAGMERLLAEELATEKMKYTLELKEKHVKQTELEALAEKARRERQAEAAGNEQIIAAKAQAEAMKHVLPFKQKQIEQRQLEMQAEKIARVQSAEANAEARKIEVTAEAESRRKLAEAEAYRLQVTGKATSEQLARDGELLSQYPLLIQKVMADKLSDKVQVIIAPTPADGGFIGSAVIGATAQQLQQQRAPQRQAGQVLTAQGQ
ncbi:MAG: prohibitin family protein [Burkholderiales bacterium]|nr:prohibitin family protein [Burkholderiales bacterium]